MIKTFAIHSPHDGEILQRMHDELVRAGFVSNEAWNEGRVPKKGSITNYNGRFTLPEHVTRSVKYFSLVAYVQDMMLEFYRHSCSRDDIHHDLTPENFESVLSEIIATITE